MGRRFKITVDGHPYDVTVEETTDGAGNAYSDTASLVQDPAPAAAPAAPPAAAPASAPPPPATCQASEPGDIVSPLAGVVVSVDVAVGDAVEDGTQLAVLEAMKMKTVVVSHQQGKIAEIAVKPRDPVVAGQLLMKIE